MAESAHGIKSPGAHVSTRIDSFLDASEEVGLVRYLARLGSNSFILAPEALLRRVRKLRVNGPGGALSSNYDSAPLFSPDIYVFDIFPGVPSVALARVRPNSNVTIINRDLIVRLVLERCSRERRIRQRAVSQTSELHSVNYCILTSPRAGGNVLAHLLRGAGVGDPAAHYREPLGASIREGFAFDDVMERIRAGAKLQGVFGTRINSQFIETSLRGRFIEFPAWVKHRNVKCIRIRRELTEQAVSLHFAVGTGVWESWDALLEDFGAGISFDREQMSEQIRYVARLDAIIDQVLLLCPDAEVMTVDYSDFARPDILLARICEFLKLPIPRFLDPSNIVLPHRISETNPHMRRAVQQLISVRTDDVLAV